MKSRPPRILAVDDEPAVLDVLHEILGAAGFQIVEARDGSGALIRVRADPPDLVLLDVRLPDFDGFALLQELRRGSAVPVIMLTARAEESEKVRGLTLGADDYVTKPFSPGELVARVQAVLRRTGTVSPPRAGQVQVDEHLVIDFDEQDAIVDGQRVRLRPTEHRLLLCLVQNAGRTLPFEAILARVWGPEYREEIHYVHLYVTYLRRKIEPDPANPRYILSRRGVGYSFRSVAGAPAISAVQ